MFNWFWRIVFWWKKRTGFIDLHATATVTGTVVALIAPDADGDRGFNLRLDSAFHGYITGFGGRLTSEDASIGPSLHCEVPPWAPLELRRFYDHLHVGDRVEVSGDWGFDGVHHAALPFWLEVLYALWRHGPNTEEGWFEIHPVEQLRFLPEPARTTETPG